MKTTILVFLCILLSNGLFGQNKCDCLITPIKPQSCFNYCLSELLKNATKEQLTNLGLTNDLANYLIKLKGDSVSINYEKFKSVFSQEKFNSLNDAIHIYNFEKSKRDEKIDMQKNDIILDHENIDKMSIDTVPNTHLKGKVE
jgi:hypothetical protein